jgi:hypothetical protein
MREQITKFWEQKLQKSRNKNPGTKVSKIQKQKLKKFGIKILGKKLQKSVNNNYKNPRTKKPESERTTGNERKLSNESGHAKWASPLLPAL